MNKKLEKQITFALLIIVIVFFSIPQVLPWFSVNVNDIEIATSYSWGIKSEIGTFDEGNSMMFHLNAFLKTLDGISNIPQEMEGEINNLKVYAIGFIFLFLMWIISILVIIFTAITFYNLYNGRDDKTHYWAVTTSMTSIIVIIIFYISSVFFIIGPIENILAESTLISGLINLNLQFSIGFFMFMIGLILITGLALKNIFINFSNRISVEEAEERKGETSGGKRRTPKASRLHR